MHLHPTHFPTNIIILVIADSVVECHIVMKPKPSRRKSELSSLNWELTLQSVTLVQGSRLLVSRPLTGLIFMWRSPPDRVKFRRCAGTQISDLPSTRRHQPHCHTGPTPEQSAVPCEHRAKHQPGKRTFRTTSTEQRHFEKIEVSPLVKNCPFLICLLQSSKGPPLVDENKI
jgi:hypothetical protein